VNASPRLMVTTALLLALANVAIASPELTKSRIPGESAPKLKTLIEKTFSPDPRKRGEAASKLGDIRDSATTAVPFLIRLLDDDASASEEAFDDVAARARESLGKIGSLSVAPIITELRHSSGKKRLALLKALGYLNDRRVVAELLSLLNDSDPEIRERAAETLMFCLDDHQEFRELPGLARSLIQAIQDGNSDIHWRIAEMLGKSHDSLAFVPLTQMANRASHEVRESAIRGLGELGDRRAAHTLQNIVESAPRNNRSQVKEAAAAADALGQIGYTDSTSHFLRTVVQNRDQASEIRCGAISGLAKCGDRRGADMLLSVLNDKRGEPYEVRQSALKAIAKIQGLAAISVLNRYASDETESRGVRFAAAMSLVDATDGKITDIGVVNAISDTGGEDRDDGEFALLKIAEHGKTKAVRAAAQDDLESKSLEELRKKGLLVSREEVTEEAREQWWHSNGRLLIISLVYYPLALALWGFMYRNSFPQKCVTVPSLLILIVLIAIGAFGVPAINSLW
jgi:HEAT repeat protein